MPRPSKPSRLENLAGGVFRHPLAPKMRPRIRRRKMQPNVELKICKGVYGGGSLTKEFSYEPDTKLVMINLIN